MRTTRNKLIVGTAATALVFGGAGIGVAQASNGHNDGAGKSTSRGASSSVAHVGKVAQADKSDEGKATGRVAQHARAAALRLLPGGTVNSVERDSENGATWEVEVTKTNGKTVDVRLDAKFMLVVIEDDSEANDAQDAAGDE